MTQQEKTARPMYLWGDANSETLTHRDSHAAIEETIDLLTTPIPDIDITVFEFKRCAIDIDELGNPLANLLERLDEEYGGEDATEPTTAMLAAERAFLAAVIAEYVPWQCERTGQTVTVNALEWAREHRPDWLESTLKGVD